MANQRIRKHFIYIQRAYRYKPLNIYEIKTKIRSPFTAKKKESCFVSSSFALLFCFTFLLFWPPGVSLRCLRERQNNIRVPLPHTTNITAAATTLSLSLSCLQKSQPTSLLLLFLYLLYLLLLLHLLSILQRSILIYNHRSSSPSQPSFLPPSHHHITLPQFVTSRTTSSTTQLV